MHVLSFEGTINFCFVDSLWVKKGGLLRKSKSLQKAVFSVNNPEPLAVMDDGK